MRASSYDFLLAGGAPTGRGLNVEQNGVAYLRRGVSQTSQIRLDSKKSCSGAIGSDLSENDKSYMMPCRACAESPAKVRARNSRDAH